MNPETGTPRAKILAGICALAAAGLFFVHPYAAAAVLLLFVAVCLAAPFLPGAGLFLPAIRRGARDSDAVALTFDDGPDPRTTPLLLKLLNRYNARAAFFVAGKRARAHPELIRQILRAGHVIGNHTWGHDVLVMLKSRKTLAREIDEAQKALASFGITPLAFRPPAGVVNPKLGPLLQQRNMICVHYSRRGPDMGNRRIRGLSGKILKKLRPGDIVLLHDVFAESRDFSPDTWLAEIENLLAGIAGKGLRTAPLSEIIGRPVMLTDDREK